MGAETASPTNVGPSRISARWFPALVVCSSLLSSSLVAQSTSARSATLAGRLAEIGFENVTVLVDGGDLTATFENNVYRYEIRALEIALDALTSDAAPGATVTVIQQQLAIPVVQISVAADRYRAMRRGELGPHESAQVMRVSFDSDALWSDLRHRLRANRSFRRIDIVAHPQFRAQFGDFDEPVRSQINVTPEFSTSLWRGMRVAVQLIFPLQNELDEGGDYVRPGLLTLSQYFRLPGSTFVVGSVGYFTQDRYGIDVQARKYFANGLWAMGGNVGYTGRASRVDGGWEYEAPDLVTFFGDAEYWFAPFDVRLSAAAGRFVFEDWGIRVDVLRRFGEVDVGFFALETERGFNAGVNFAVPLLPRRALVAGRVRMRPARIFRWEYRYHGFPISGIRYRTGAGIDDLVGRLRPAEVKSQLTHQRSP